MVSNLLSKGPPPLIKRIELNKKTVRISSPRLLKYLRPWDTVHPPTAFADYSWVLVISRRQWGKLFGPAVPRKVVATVKIRIIKLIRFHS
jgi:hypothetical protein